MSGVERGKTQRNVQRVTYRYADSSSSQTCFRQIARMLLQTPPENYWRLWAPIWSAWVTR